MRVFRGIEEAKGIRNPVVTTGSFDGVHLGHKAIIHRVNALARQIGGESVLLTFHPHPRKVLYPDTVGKELRLIYTQREKVRLLSETGLDNLLIIPFTKAFSETGPIDFIRRVLVEGLGMKKAVVGFNHHFGHNREGGFEYLFELGRYYGFTVEEIPEQDLEHEAVSSTRIRKALSEGNIQRANAYLDHLFLMIGPVNRLPALNGGPEHERAAIGLEESEKLIPPAGLYAADISMGDQARKCLVRCQDQEPAGRPVSPEVYLGAGEKLPDGTEGVLRFRKRLSGPGPIKESSIEDIREGLRQVEELIY